MTSYLASDGQVQVPIQTVAPAAATGTGSFAVVSGSEMDLSCYKSLAYTVVAAAAAMDWAVYGANASDYSDEQQVYTKANVLAAGVDAYTVFPAPYLFYRVKVKNNAGSTGTATVRGAAKL